MCYQEVPKRLYLGMRSASPLNLDHLRGKTGLSPIADLPQVWSYRWKSGSHIHSGPLFESPMIDDPLEMLMAWN